LREADTVGVAVAEVEVEECPYVVVDAKPW
jgi:hypothetical protein